MTKIFTSKTSNFFYTSVVFEQLLNRVSLSELQFKIFITECQFFNYSSDRCIHYVKYIFVQWCLKYRVSGSNVRCANSSVYACVTVKRHSQAPCIAVLYTDVYQAFFLILWSHYEVFQSLFPNFYYTLPTVRTTRETIRNNSMNDFVIRRTTEGLR